MNIIKVRTKLIASFILIVISFITIYGLVDELEYRANLVAVESYNVDIR